MSFSYSETGPCVSKLDELDIVSALPIIIVYLFSQMDGFSFRALSQLVAGHFGNQISVVSATTRYEQC